MLREQDIISEYLGIPFKHRGRDKDGMDCYGFIRDAYKRFLGLILWDIEEDYDQDWAWKGRDHFIENYYREWEKVKEPKIFDVIGFKNNSGVVNHAGIYLNKYKFIHCVINVGVIVTRFSDAKWQKRIEGYYRLRARNNGND